MVGIDEALYKACEDNRKLEVEIEEKDKEIERLREKLEDETLNKEIAQGHRKQVQDIELQERKEIERLNNVINELEKWIRWKMLHCIDYECFPEETLDKLKSLKEGK